MTVTYIYPPVEADTGSLYEGFVAYMQAQIPGWQPYSGELDDWLARAFTAVGSQLMEITSDVATSIFRYFGAFLLNLPPHVATSATGLITITVQDTVGYTIPAFTQMSFPDATGTLQGFETLTDTVIAPGASTATNVLVQAMTAGAAGNGCTGSGDLDGSTPLTFITALALSTTTSGGADDESDDAYLTRLTQTLTTLTTSPITADNFTVLAGTQSGVGRAVTLAGFNPANAIQTGNTHTSTTVDNLSNTALIPLGASVSGSGVPGGAFVTEITSGTAIKISAPTSSTLTGATLTFGGSLLQGGYVASWVTDALGAALTSPEMATIAAAIQALCMANVTYNVLAPTYTAISVTASVVAWPGQNTSAVQSAVQSALTNFLEPSNFGAVLGQLASGWTVDNKIRVVVLENVIMNVLGVHYVSSLTINGGSDLALGGIVPLPTPGTMTVTVTSG